MSALSMSRAAATLPLLENLFETMTARELKRRALSGIARNDNHDGAASSGVLQDQIGEERRLTDASWADHVQVVAGVFYR